MRIDADGKQEDRLNKTKRARDEKEIEKRTERGGQPRLDDELAEYMYMLWVVLPHDLLLDIGSIVVRRDVEFTSNGVNGLGARLIG